MGKPDLRNWKTRLKSEAENPVSYGGEIPEDPHENKWHLERLSDLGPWFDASGRLSSFMTSQMTNIQLLKQSGKSPQTDAIKTMVKRAATAGVMKEKVDAYIERRLQDNLKALNKEAEKDEV